MASQKASLNGFAKSWNKPWSKYDSAASSKDEDSTYSLLSGENIRRRDSQRRNWPLAISVAVNLILGFGLTLLVLRKQSDPALQIYSPVNHLIEYHVTNISTGFMTKTPYMGFPNDEIDGMWEDLYQYGDSAITKEEADRLALPTINERGTDRYLIQLEVFHQLHCLNDLRKAFYPERWPKKWEYNEDGTVNRNTMQFRHWDHCIDILRSTLMCNADVSPITWRLNLPVGAVLAPNLETTHTCRNFSKIVEWARMHEATDLRQEVTQEERQEIIDNPPFDQTAWEDLSEFWAAFPGNTYFKQWQTGWNETDEGRAFWHQWHIDQAQKHEDLPEFVEPHDH